MTPIKNLPSVVINDLVLHMQGLRDCDLKQRCSTTTSVQIDQKLRDGIAPKELHDFMVAATVFGDPDRASEVMRTWMSPLPHESWQKWLDVTNVSSATKRSYGHEALRRGCSDGSATEDRPLTKMILEVGYLTAPRQSKGPLESLLRCPSGNPAEDGQLLDIMLAAERKAPGSCITSEAREALAQSQLKSSVLLRTMSIGLDLALWIGGANQTADLKREIDSLRLSVEARRAAERAIEEVLPSSAKARKT